MNPITERKAELQRTDTLKHVNMERVGTISSIDIRTTSGAHAAFAFTKDMNVEAIAFALESAASRLRGDSERRARTTADAEARRGTAA